MVTKVSLKELNSIVISIQTNSIKCSRIKHKNQFVLTYTFADYSQSIIHYFKNGFVSISIMNKSFQTIAEFSS